ncbi:hypothetical protein Hdeb2414_s0089g00787241 [Helianthus debilis subsp. tardiflorus]
MRFSLAVITPMIGGIPEPTDLVMTASRVPPQAAEIAAMWLYRPNQKRTVVVAVMVAYKRGCRSVEFIYNIAFSYLFSFWRFIFYKLKK